MGKIVLIILFTIPLWGDEIEWGWHVAIKPQMVITQDCFTPQIGTTLGYEIYDFDYELMLQTTGDQVALFAAFGQDHVFYIFDIHPHLGYRIYGGYHERGFEGGIYLDTALLYNFYTIWKRLSIGFSGAVALIYQKKQFTPALISAFVIRID